MEHLRRALSSGAGRARPTGACVRVRGEEITMESRILRVAGLALIGGPALCSAATDVKGQPTVVISGDRTKESHDCHGGSASITGKHNTVSLRHCSLVTIVGNFNHVTMEEECPALEVWGNSNEIAAGRAKSISVPGNQNTVTWSSARDRKSTRLNSSHLGIS